MVVLLIAVWLVLPLGGCNFFSCNCNYRKHAACIRRYFAIFLPESEGGIRRRVRRQPGGESGRDWCMDVGPPVRAAATQGTRLGGSRHGHGLGTADAAKRATISTSIAAGRCGRPTAEAAERRLAGIAAQTRLDLWISRSGTAWVEPWVEQTKRQAYALSSFRTQGHRDDSNVGNVVRRRGNGV